MIGLFEYKTILTLIKVIFSSLNLDSYLLKVGFICINRKLLKMKKKFFSYLKFFSLSRYLNFYPDFFGDEVKRLEKFLEKTISKFMT